MNFWYLYLERASRTNPIKSEKESTVVRLSEILFHVRPTHTVWDNVYHWNYLQINVRFFTVKVLTSS